jgi:hypothetical protein
MSDELQLVVPNQTRTLQLYIRAYKYCYRWHDKLKLVGHCYAEDAKR